MLVKKLTLNSPDYPLKLRTISTAPKQLYVLSNYDVNELLSKPCVAVVGSRKVSVYGKTVTTTLTEALAKSGIVIISGLALGVDCISHIAALDAGGKTIAVLPSGLKHIYPRTNIGLARRILASGGALVSEYPPDEPLAYKGNFIARNRIIAGLSDALLVTEAAAGSGSLHTADFAIDQGREVLAVPGNITSPTSAGTNNLIKSGATPVTDIADVMHVLGIEASAPKPAPTSDNPKEQIILDLLFSGISDAAELLSGSQLDTSTFNQTLTMLEIRGRIRPLGANCWALI